MSSANRRKIGKGVQDRQNRWEFLRRAPEYRLAYQEFKESYGEWLECDLDPAWPLREGEMRGEDPHDPQKGSFMVRAIEAQQAFERRWGIEPMDPEIRWSPFLNRQQIWVMEEGPHHSLAADPDVVTLCINTRGPLEEVMSQLEGRVRREQRRRKEKEPPTKTRKPVSKIPKYLKAYDLRQEGKMDREIADVLELTDEKAAKRYRDRAAELISAAASGEIERNENGVDSPDL